MQHAPRTTSYSAPTALRLTACALLLCIPARAQDLGVRPRADRAASSPTQVGASGTRTEGAPEAPPFAVPPLTEVLYSTTEDGTTWASGSSYKASFGPDGATYIPFLGSEAPRNYPVSLSLATATVGGAPIELSPAAGAVRTGDKVTIDRGPIDEVYELSIGQVEQCFVVKERPQAGALDLFVPLTSELQLVSEDGDVKLRGDHGVVNYGRAFARLDDGSRVPLDSSVVAGGVHIHVDADFMASAHFPLVIDPIVSTFAITVFGHAPTISYDASTDRYLIAWEYDFSSTDHDVFYHVRTAGGAPIANGTIDNSIDDYRHVKAANLEGHDQWLCVFQLRLSGTTGWSIWGKTIEAPTAAVSVRFLISAADTAGDKINPDVGGDPYFGEGYYCVVWQRELTGERDIHARLVRYNHALIGSGTMLIDNTIGAVDSHPAISKSNGQLSSSSAWTIAWQRAGTTSDVYAARIDYNGIMLNPPTLMAHSSWEDASPDVSSPGADGRVCLVYSEDDYFRYKILNGVTVEASGDIFNLYTTEPFYIYEYDFSVDSDGTHFVAAFKHTGFSTYYPFVLTLARLTQSSYLVTEGLLPLGTQPGGSPDVASKWSSGGANHDFGIVWDGGGIDGVTYYRPFGGPITTSCASYFGNQCPCSNAGYYAYGCGNSQYAGGALLAADGNAATGAQDDVRFVLSNTPTGSPAILFQGTSTSSSTSTFGDGALCTTGSLTHFAVKFPNTSGTMIWPGSGEAQISVQGNVPLAGGQRWYQAYYRDSASFCTPATFNISNGVKVHWLP